GIGIGIGRGRGRGRGRWSWIRRGSTGATLRERRSPKHEQREKRDERGLHGIRKTRIGSARKISGRFRLMDMRGRILVLALAFACESGNRATRPVAVTAPPPAPMPDAAVAAAAPVDAAVPDAAVV